MSPTTTDIQQWQQALADDPTNRAAFDALEEAFVLSKRWRELAKLYHQLGARLNVDANFWIRLLTRLERLFPQLGDSGEQSELLGVMGDVLQARLGDLKKALVCYQKAFQISSANIDALLKARAIYARGQKWEMVLRLYELELRVTQARERQVEIFREMGDIFVRHLGDRDRGIKFIQRAMELDPGDETTAAMLRAHMGGDDAEPEAAAPPPVPATPEPEAAPEPEAEAAPEPEPEAAPEPVAEAAPEPEVAPEPVAEAAPEPEPEPVAEPAPEPAADPEPEVAQAPEAAPAPAPAAPAPPPVPAQAAAPPPVPAQAAAPPPVPAEAGEPQWQREVASLMDKLPGSPPKVQADLNAQIAALLLDNAPERAEVIEDHIQQALALAPDHAQAAALHKALLRAQGRWEALAEALEARAALGARLGREALLQARIELALVRNNHLDDEAAAVAAFEQVLELDPTHPAALRCAQDFYEKRKDWDALIKLYEGALRQKRRTDGELELLLEYGEMLWKRVGDLDQADRQFKRVRLADAKHPLMLAFYLDYFRAKEDWRKLYTTLNSLRQVEEDEARSLALAVEMADVAQHRMDSPAKAIDVWKSVLRIDARNAQAREALRALYTDTQKWNALLELYKEDIQALGDDDDAPGVRAAKVAIHLEMVEIYQDRLRIEMMVTNTYNAILQLDPTNSPAIDALATRYEAGKRWTELIDVLQRKADAVADDPAEAIPLLHRIADLWKSRLGNTPQAIPVLERILELEPKDAEAIGHLKDIYGQRRDWPNLIEVLDKETALLTGKALAAHLTEMADIAGKRLRDDALAQRLHERVLEALEPSDGGGAIEDVGLYRTALEALEGIYSAKDDPQLLIPILERYLHITDSPQERVGVLQRLAKLVFEDDPERAVALWHQVLDLDEADTAAQGALAEFYVERQRWEALEALYARRGAWATLFDLLDNAAGLVSDDAAEVGLYHQMARIARDHLDAPDRVTLSLESILRIEPTNVAVATQLIPYYAQAEQWDKQVEVTRILLDNDGGEPFALTRQIAQLYEARLGQLDEALDWESRAFRMRPDDAALREHLEGLARRAGKLQDLVSITREVADEVEDDALRLSLFRVVARTSHRDLGWDSEAVDYYQRLLGAMPEDAEAIGALHALYRRQERWDDLLDILTRKVALTDAGEDRAAAVALHFEIADLHQEHLGQRLEAVDSYETILGLEPDNLKAVHGLKAIWLHASAWDKVAEVLKRELALRTRALAAAQPAAEGAEGAEGEGASDEAEAHALAAQTLRLELGNLYEHQLDAHDEAIAWYAALLGDQESEARPPAVSALEGLLHLHHDSHRARAVRIATLLEPVHRQDANHASLAEMLEIRLSAMEDAGERKATLWELARLYEEHTGQPDRAFGALERLLGESPSEPEVWNELERVAGTSDRWADVAELYAEITPSRDALDADGWSFDLLRREARIYEQELERYDLARDAYETLLARDGADMMAINNLDPVYGKLEAWEDQVDLLSRKAELVEAEARKAVRFRIARIYQDHLDRPDEAIASVRKIVAEDPDDPEAIGHLMALLRDQGRLDELVELLGARIARADAPAARHALQYELGLLFEGPLGRRAEAVEAYRQVLREDAGQADALAAMERLSEALQGQNGDEELALRRAIDDTLEPIYTASERWAKLAHLLTLRLEYAEGDADRAQLHIRTARLHRDKLDQPGEGFGHLREAVALCFDDAALRAEFEALGDAAGLHGQVVALYEDLLVGGDDALRAAVLRRIAALQEHHLGDAPAAIDAWRRLLDLDAEDAEVLGHLERLYAQAEAWAELVEICQRQAALAEGDAATVEVLHKVGQLHRDRLDDPIAAIETFVRILDLAPDDRGALDALEQLYAGQESWRELIQIHTAKAALADDASDAQRAHLWAIATLYRDRLFEPDSAIDAFARILDLRPQDRPALDALDVMYADQDQWESLVEVLRRKFDLEEDSEAKTTLQLRLGQVQQHQLLDPEAAIATYDAVLQRDAGEARTREALEGLLEDPMWRFKASKVLEPHVRASEDHEALARLLELQLLDTEAVAGQLALLDEVAALQEGPLGDAQAAFGAVRRGYERDPLNPQRVAELERLAELGGLYDALVETYERVLPEVQEGGERLRVHLKVAAVYRDQLGDAMSAEGAYRTALSEAPACLEALEALEAMFGEQARWVDLLEIYEDRVRLAQEAGDAATARAFLFQAATLNEEHRQDPGEAINTYLRVLQLDPKDREAIAALKRLYRAESRWFELADQLRDEIALTDDAAQAVALRYALAQVCQNELGDTAQAVEVYASILAIDADHAETIAALEALFDAELETQAAAAMLERIYWRREAWAKLAKVLEVRFEELEDPDARAATLTQIARIFEDKLGDLKSSSYFYGRLLAETPNQAGVLDQLERQAALLDAWGDVADTYRDILVHNLKFDDAGRTRMLVRRAVILDERLDLTDEALQVYREVLAFNEDHAEANDAVERLLTRERQWYDLADLYRQQALMLESDQARLEVNVKLATLQEELLGDTDGAIEAYRQILSIDPDAEDAIRNLERLLREDQRWAEVADLYRREAGRAEDDDAVIALKHRLALVLYRKLDEAAEAVGILRDILDERPDHKAARASLEDLLRDLADSSPMSDDLRLQIALLLLPLYDEATEWPKLVNVYKVQLDTVQDHTLRAQALTQIARLREEREENREAAFSAYAQAFAENVDSEALRGNLERLSAELGLWERLVEIYRDGLSQTVNANRQKELLHRIAQLYLTHLSNSGEAIDAYRQVLNIDPYDAEAIDRLEQLYRSTQQPNDLVEILDRKVEIAQDDPSRKAILVQLAAIWEDDLSDPDEAIRVFQRIRDLDPDDLATVASLERLFARVEDWGELIMTYLTKLNLLDDDASKIETHLKMATIYETELNDVDEAISAYRTVRTLDADHAGAIANLDRLFTETARWDDLLEILKALRARAGQDADALSGVEFRMAQLLEEHLYDTPQAIDLYSQIVQRSPDHPGALDALEALLDQPEHRARIVAVLKPLYAAAGEWRKLIDALERRIDDIFEPADKRALFEELAQIHEAKLDEPAAAFERYTQAFAQEVEHPSPRANLERLAAAHGSWEELVRAYEDNLGAIFEPDLNQAVQMRIGAVLEDHIQDPDRAIDRYTEALRVNPGHEGALEALDRLYTQTERWADLIDILDQKLRVAEGDAVNPLKVRLAALGLAHFDDADRAVALYREVVLDDTSDEAAMLALEELAERESHRMEIADLLAPIYRQHGAWDKLVHLLALKLVLQDEPFDRAESWTQIAQLRRDHLDAPAGAFDAYAEALRVNPEARDLYAPVEALAASQERWADIAELYDAILPDIYDDETRQAFLTKLAGWYQTKLDNLDLAEARYLALLDLNRERYDAYDALIAIYQQRGDDRALIDTLQRKADATFDAPDRKALLKRVAALALGDLDDTDRAIEAFEAIQTLDDLDLDAKRRLAELFARQERWTDRIEVLGRVIELTEDADERLRLRVDVARSTQGQLGDDWAAIDAWREVLYIDPNHREALVTLEALYRDNAQWSDLRDNLLQRANQADADDAAKLDLYLKLAPLFEEHLSDVYSAIDHYGMILEIDKDHPVALAELERLYRSSERWYDLQEIYLALLPKATERDEIIRLNVAISDLAANHLGDPQTAKTHLQSVLELDPNNLPALSVLGRLYQLDGEWAKAREVIEQQLANSSPGPQQAALYASRGKLNADHFDDLAQAQADYLKALDLDPSLASVRGDLKALYQQTEQWQPLADILRDEAAEASDPAEQVRLYQELATMARERLSDAALAVSALESAHAIQPDDLDVAEPLLQAYIDNDQPAKAEPILDSIIATLTEARKLKQLFPFHHMRGQLAERQGDTAQAVDSYKAAYDIDRTHVPNLLALGQLYIQAESWDDALQIFQALLLQQMKIKDKDQKLAIFYNFGVVRMKLGDPRRAKDMFNRALGIDRHHQPSKDALAQL